MLTYTHLREFLDRLEPHLSELPADIREPIDIAVADHVGRVADMIRQRDNYEWWMQHPELAGGCDGTAIFFPLPQGAIAAALSPHLTISPGLAQAVRRRRQMRDWWFARLMRVATRAAGAVCGIFAGSSARTRAAESSCNGK